MMLHAVLTLASALTLTATQAALAQNAAPVADGRQAACGSNGPIVYDDHDATVHNLRQLYRSEQFADLDAALDCLWKSPRVFRSGRLGSSAIYWLYRRELPAPGTSDEAMRLARAWRKERPSSIFAEFASLRLMYATAWNVRGSASAQDVSTRNMEAFGTGLLAAEKAIRQSSKKLQATPMWHNLLLATVLDSPRTSANANEILSTALRRWPNYYDFYEVALSRKVPRWGGSWDAVDRFIGEQSSMPKPAEGETLYARLYWSVVATGASPRETLLSWPRMKLSLDSLIERYPDPVHKNVAASFACAYSDLQYARKIWNQLPIADIRPSVWIRGTDPNSCPT